MKGFVVAALLLLLAGCSGDGISGLDDDEIILLASDPRVLRLGGIVERADTMLVSGVHVTYSVSALGETTTDSLVQEVSCSGIECAGSGVEFNLTDPILTDLIDPSSDVSVNEANLRSRDDGFDTASIKGNLDPADIGILLGILLPETEITIIEIPEGQVYSLWGKHGMAGLFLADDPFSARVNNIPLSGDMKVAVPFVLGDAAGTNPDSIGGATWTGIAEIVSTRTFMRREGTATLTIPDLLQPTVNVGIDIDENPIGKPGWSGMPLVDGRFSFGTAGLDYLEGDFYGVGHSEAYGVFDTETFTGAFGAKRQVGDQ